MALALRLILLLLLAVALPARTAQAAPWRAQGAVMDQKSVQKEELPGGSSSSVAASAAERKEMADTNTVTDADKARADWERDMDYLEMMANGGLKAVPDAEGKSATQLL
ncbi:hypothetical protein DUI87_34494 [Hirundo rustica rustica]|uniref:Uncharacterized protein n=1 Tax=Hirundo rustica rustica TaxID=333673 RepID=A0A3M0IK86_HIRRU|nr:hypothetical protein DUI87_34494 [Hirundo rustica rustica]